MSGTKGSGRRGEEGEETVGELALTGGLMTTMATCSWELSRTLLRGRWLIHQRTDVIINGRCRWQMTVGEMGSGRGWRFEMEQRMGGTGMKEDTRKGEEKWEEIGRSFKETEVGWCMAKCMERYMCMCLYRLMDKNSYLSWRRDRDRKEVGK